VQIHREIGARYSEGIALNLLGATLLQVGRSEEAAPAAQEAAQIFRQMRDQRSRAGALNNLGGALQGARRFEEATSTPLWTGSRPLMLSPG